MEMEVREMILQVCHKPYPRMLTDSLSLGCLSTSCAIDSKLPSAATISTWLKFFESSTLRSVYCNLQLVHRLTRTNDTYVVVPQCMLCCNFSRSISKCQTSIRETHTSSS